METARIGGLADALRDAVFVLAEGKVRRGSELLDSVVSAEEFEYALKDHSDHVVLACIECAGPAKHRRGPKVGDGPRGRANFSATHDRKGCGLASAATTPAEGADEPTHYRLVIRESDRSPPEAERDDSGRLNVRVDLDELMRVARAKAVHPDDALTFGRHTWRLSDFLLASTAVPPDGTVGETRAIWGRVRSVRPARHGTFVILEGSLVVLVAQNALGEVATRWDEFANMPCIVLGRVERSGHGYLVRVGEMTYLHVARPPRAARAKAAPSIAVVAATAPSRKVATTPDMSVPSNIAPAPAPQSHSKPPTKLDSPPAQALAARAKPKSIIEWLLDGWRRLISSLVPR